MEVYHSTQFFDWLKEMLSNIQMKGLCLHKRFTHNRFERMWEPFLASDISLWGPQFMLFGLDPMMLL